MRQGVDERLAEFPPQPMTNRELWRWRVEQTPDRRWLWHDARSWSYAEFDLEVRRLAGGFAATGIEPGTRVLVGMTNRPETVAVHLALIQVGAVCVPLVPGMPLVELIHPIRNSEAAILVATDPIASAVLEQPEDVASIERIVVLGKVSAESSAEVERY